jgi:putative serine/threonine protein kinase
LVVKARHSEIGLCALKIRRTDADRIEMSREAALHHVANDAGVGPQIHSFSKNFLIMELAPGEKISSWASGRISRRTAKAVATSVIDQCHRLDMAGLDHGELSRISGHVFVSGSSATIVDFESASTSRKVSNVTCAAQALFLYGGIANRITDKLGKPDMNLTLVALRRYKKEVSRDSLRMILNTLMPS